MKVFKSDKLYCRSRNVIYLGFCNNVGKSEPPVNLQINMHRHKVKSPNGAQFDKHFNLPGHDYNENARFILIEQEDNRQLLEDRKDNWMMKVKTDQMD